jgi:hypothetical protein
LPSETDKAYFSNKFQKVEYIPAFHPFNSINIPSGKGTYILYHGNLSVAENKEAALFLTRDVFPLIKADCVIAGKNPGNELSRAVRKYSNIRLVANPPDDEMKQLISGAQIHVLPSFSSSGMKLKLLTSLFNGRHCVVNSKMVAGTGLDDCCTIAETAIDFAREINLLIDEPFTGNILDRRKQILSSRFSNALNAKALADLL